LSTEYNFNRLKLSVIGCGNWGKNLVRVLSELKVLHSICDISPIKKKHFQEKYGVPSLSVEEIIADNTIDGVLIATPSVTHFKLASKLLANNKHVYVEKPFTLATEDAIALDNIASKHQKVLMVGHLLPYHRAFQTLKALKKSGELGEIHYISSHRSNFGNFQTEENVLWDYTPHDVSMILSLVEVMPYQVYAVGTSHLPHTQADVSCLNLNFHPNTQAHIFASWLHPIKEQKLTVVGSKAMVIFDDCQPWDKKLQIFTNPSQASDDFLPQKLTGKHLPLEPAEPLREECCHFLTCILNNEIPQTNGKEGIAVTRILTSAAKSIIKQQPVSLANSIPSAKPLQESVV